MPQQAEGYRSSGEGSTQLHQANGGSAAARLTCAGLRSSLARRCSANPADSGIGEHPAIAISGDPKIYLAAGREREEGAPTSGA